MKNFSFFTTLASLILATGLAAANEQNLSGREVYDILSAALEAENNNTDCKFSVKWNDSTGVIYLTIDTASGKNYQIDNYVSAVLKTNSSGHREMETVENIKIESAKMGDTKYSFTFRSSDGIAIDRIYLRQFQVKKVNRGSFEKPSLEKDWVAVTYNTICN